MPHIIIEYPAAQASSLQVEAMLVAVHRAVVGTGLFDEGHIRVRGWPLLHYLVGGERRGFVHAQCRIHTGRSPEQRRMLSEAVLAALGAQQWVVEVITVEVVELAGESYAKAYVKTDDSGDG